MVAIDVILKINRALLCHNFLRIESIPAVQLPIWLPMVAILKISLTLFEIGMS